MLVQNLARDHTSMSGNIFDQLDRVRPETPVGEDQVNLESAKTQPFPSDIFFVKKAFKSDSDQADAAGVQRFPFRQGRGYIAVNIYIKFFNNLAKF